MIWLSVSQETAKVHGPRPTNGQPGLGTPIRASASQHITWLIKFAPDVVACVAVTVSWRLVAVHGNHGKRANNRGNALTFPS
jgi:hypothetical protein